MRNQRVEYRVNGSDLYAIDLLPQRNGTYELVVRYHPPDLHGKGANHHHLFDNKRICVTASRKPKSVQQAKLIATVWAAGWSQYRRTGRFPGS